MQITLTLPDEIVKQLLSLPQPEEFMREAICTAVYNLSSLSSPPSSKWAQVVQRIRENPIDLGDYTDQFRRDRQEFRENFVFQRDSAI
jgi:hypothetical protein